MTGEAKILDDCLYVGDAVVVWNAEDYGYVASIIDAAQRGSRIPVRIAAEELKIVEGTTDAEIPSGLVERCPTQTLWAANPPNSPSGGANPRRS